MNHSDNIKIQNYIIKLIALSEDYGYYTDKEYTMEISTKRKRLIEELEDFLDSLED